HCQHRVPRSLLDRPPSRAMTKENASRRLVLILRVTLGLELQCKLFAAALDPPAFRQHVHDVGHDEIEQPLVMRDDDHWTLARAQPDDAVLHDTDSLDI